MREINDGARLYLELIKKCLTNSIYGEHEVLSVAPAGYVKRQIQMLFRALGISLVRPSSYSAAMRARGLDWPPFAHTMMGTAWLDNLQQCVEDILASGVPGDLIETGVWRGGGTIFMRAILKAYSVTTRNVWVADSFEGLPPPDVVNYPKDQGDLHYTQERLAVSQEEVMFNFQKYDLLDNQVRFLKGWFCDTLPRLEVSDFALIRLDGDMYESTMDALVSLYPKLSVGGYIIIDDWGAVAACRQAVEDYRCRNDIVEEIVPIDGIGVYWKRQYGKAGI
ncbi:TylF/MycF family methyltransferase [uncultured Thiodictyon sp.]|uniref:TylF/MycF family methyltransferase n=1 Tax=uncultured Thiodictyon sp. TaxID=1846217 RepID=UPI0025EC4366|nr:TylF/MycF family methyltransferase [uncultured Thiodictyon sp.]